MAASSSFSAGLSSPSAALQSDANAPATPLGTTHAPAEKNPASTGAAPRPSPADRFGSAIESIRAPIIVVAPDSFKGSLSAEAVSHALADGLRRALPEATIRLCPMADGGEGTLDALVAANRSHAQCESLVVANAAGQDRAAKIGFIQRTDGCDAIIETAEIVGITDPDGMRVDVAERTTLGVGEALLAALTREPSLRRVYVALGGSSTNDGGAGLLCALGARLFDAEDRPLPPLPSALSGVARIDLAQLDPRLQTIELIAMSDVDNPLCGPRGATAVFGPQKGVDQAQVAILDAALAHFADCLETATAKRLRDAPGAGAAGGLGYALLMLGARFRPGAEVVADQIGLDAALHEADWLISGEGRSDVQTLGGKAPFVACRRAAALGVPTTLLSGAVDAAALSVLGQYFSGCLSIASGPMPLADAMHNAAALLSDAAEQLARLRYRLTVSTR